MPLRLGSPLPEITGATTWLNGGAPALAHPPGHPVLVHFWAVSCHMCHNQEETVRQWQEAYGPQGLEVIALHMPRQPEDMDIERVKEHMAEMHMATPCGIDNAHAVADAFENRFVPAYFLFDKDGRLVARTAGENGISLLERPITRLFGE